MGFFSSIVGGLFGGAEEDAGNIQEDFNQKGIDEIKGFLEEGRADLFPFAQVGTNSLPFAQQFANPAFLGQNLQGIEGALQPLVDMRQREATGALSRAGLTRSGAALTAAGDVKQDILLQMENLLSGRLQGLTQLGANSAGQRANLSGQAGSSIAELLNASGQAQGAASVGSSNSTLSSLGSIAGIAAGIFSDERLKENPVVIDQVADLNVYRWGWKDWVPDYMRLMDIGFMYSEVKEKYPDFVVDNNGVGMVAYLPLIKHLKEVA